MYKECTLFECPRFECEDYDEYCWICQYYKTLNEIKLEGSK